MDKLLVAALGNRNSGKSRTWNTLFNDTVRTGIKLRRLYLSENEFVRVYLVSGSPEEREKYVGDLIRVKDPAIVLCSIQYHKRVIETIDYFSERDYEIYCQWLNPGYRDQNDCRQFDRLGIFDYLIGLNSTVGIRNGKVNENL